MASGPDPAFPAARYELARLAALIGDDSRAAMLLALLDGGELPARELAEQSGVSPATASEHLRRLSQGGLVHVEARGRQRFFRLASGQVADVVVGLASLSPVPAVTRQKLALEPARRAFRRARVCHHHLAGALGVALTEALVREGTLTRQGASYAISKKGHDRLRKLGAVPTLPAGASPTERARPCQDWTEGSAHLGGALGEALLERWLSRGWLRRGPSGRTLQVTARGERELPRLFETRLSDGCFS